MKEKIAKYSALLFSGIFNPCLIPAFGLLMIMSFIPGVEFFSLKLKLIILGVVFLSTCFIPLIFITLGTLHRGWNKESNDHFDMVLHYLFTAICAFLGSQFLGRLPIPGIFRIFLLGICLIMLVSTLISIKWKISEHTLALGGLWGTLLALNFKFGMNFIWLIAVVIIVTGVVGSSRIYLEKNTSNQVYRGFLTGMIGMFLIIAFI